MSRWPPARTGPAAAAPHPWLTAARVRAYALMIVAIFGVAFAGWTVLAWPSGVDPHGKPVGYDFITFWSAARLALDGRPAAAFDWRATRALQPWGGRGVGRRVPS